MALKFLGRFVSRATREESKTFEALTLAAANALQEKQYELAVQLYGELIESNRDRAEMLYKRANALNALGRWQEALVDYDGAISLDPAHARAYCNRGSVLDQLARWNEALESYDKSLSLNPGDFLSHYNRGSALKELKRFDEALASYERALTLNESHAPAFVNRGNVLHELGQLEAAIVSYDRAIELKADIAEAFQGRGVSLLDIGRFKEALSSFDRALYIRSDYAEAYCNRGTVLQQFGQHEAALGSFAKAIELNASLAAAFHGLGFSQLRLQRFEAAIESYGKARAIEPDRKYLLGMLLNAKMQICEWRGLEAELAELTAGLDAHKPVAVPLPVLALVDSPRLHQRVATIWADNENARHEAPVVPALQRGAKIRVGYFSADFYEHAVSLATAELFEMHDRSRFEITAFAFGPRPEDAMRSRLRKAFDRYIDVRDESDANVAQLARSLGIDIAVDLGGYTEYARTNIFARRAAPLQINYLGYPGTMGAGFMDYLIADRAVVPEEHRQHYTEKIIYMPDSFFPSDCTRSIAEAEPTREQLGLPYEGFVFCCFNQSYKISARMFASWMRILSRTHGSVLWLAHNDPVTAHNLRREAARLGVDENRLVFATRIASLSGHLARLRVADLFLDTLPYNAHATASDALWAGLPILTCRGESFAARVGASLLKAVGLPELITTTLEQYENLAVQLATNPRLLAGIRSKLRSNRSDAPLFDTKSFAVHLEAAYSRILERHRAGLAPDDISVAPR